nr:immunoglobulin light chain junction region [Macaca mulatta]
DHYCVIWHNNAWVF